MSFILDALRKSEHERQRQTGPDIAPLHNPPLRPTFPVWVIGIGALLAINLMVVLVLVFRGERQAAPTSEAASPPPIISPLPSVAANPAPVVAAPATQAPPVQVPVAANTAPYPAPEPAIPKDPMLNSPAPHPMSQPAAATNERLPSIYELNLQGVNALPQLHLDIHVYATQPAERFVFINMKKYKEGEQMAEGIRVERIIPDGAILDRNGTRFVLPRQ